MKKNRGQALVEFVIILPIFVFMLLAIIDIGKIIVVKNRLESEIDQIIEYYHNGNSFAEINAKVKEDNETSTLEIKNENNQYVTFYLKEKIDIITPGLNLIFKPPYEVTIERSIDYES